MHCRLHLSTSHSSWHCSTCQLLWQLAVGCAVDSTVGCGAGCGASCIVHVHAHELSSETGGFRHMGRRSQSRRGPWSPKCCSVRVDAPDCSSTRSSSLYSQCRGCLLTFEHDQCPLLLPPDSFSIPSLSYRRQQSAPVQGDPRCTVAVCMAAVPLLYA